MLIPVEYYCIGRSTVKRLEAHQAYLFYLFIVHEQAQQVR